MTEAQHCVPAELKLRSPDRVRLHQAGMKARLRYPGPVGELIARELDIWLQFGYRFEARGLTGRLVRHLLDEDG
jgi:hypothetical protein